MSEIHFKRALYTQLDSFSVFSAYNLLALWLLAGFFMYVCHASHSLMNAQCDDDDTACLVRLIVLVCYHVTMTKRDEISPLDTVDSHTIVVF